MGRVGRAATCLDSTQKTSEEWRENRCVINVVGFQPKPPC